MICWIVTNGYMGNGSVAAFVPGPTEKEAFSQAIDAFRNEHADTGSMFGRQMVGEELEAWMDKYKDEFTPNPRWRAEKIELPYVCEVS